MEKAESILKEFDDTIHLNMRVGDLSVAQKQVIEITKAISADCSVLIMDEPTRGVDVGAKTEIHNIIRALASEGKGVIIFSSELQEIVHLCDRIVLMHEGNIREVLKNSEEIDTDHIMKVVAGEEAQ